MRNYNLITNHTKMKTKKNLAELDLKIASVVKEARNNKGLMQKHIAHSINISTTKYSRMEDGKVQMSIVELLQICNALGVSIHYILGTAGFTR